MIDNGMIEGKVVSHTVIRIAGKLHMDRVPFVLLLTATKNGTHLLGHFDGIEPPPIGTAVTAHLNTGSTLIFTTAKEQL